VSEPVIITDADELQLAEGPETTLRGTGLVPYPAVPGPAPRPAS
jgi:hypothetical protein